MKLKCKMDRRHFLQLAGAAAAAGALAGCGKKTAKERAADQIGEVLNSMMEEKLNADQQGASSAASAGAESTASSSEAASENHDEIGAEEIYESYMVGDTSSGYSAAKKGDNRIEVSVVCYDAEEIPYYLEELAPAYGAAAAGVHDHSWDAEVDFYFILSQSILRGETINGGDDGIRVWVPAGTKATCSMHAWSEDGASFDLDSAEFELTSDSIFEYTGCAGVEVEQE